MSKLIFETLSNNIYKHQLLPIQYYMETQMNNIFFVDTKIFFIALSKNDTASLQRIEAVITINKNRRAPHIVQIVPFNLISCHAVDSEQCAILKWAVRYPAFRVRDYLGFRGLPVLTSTLLLSRNKSSVLVIPMGQDKKSNDVSRVLFQLRPPDGIRRVECLTFQA